MAALPEVLGEIRTRAEARGRRPCGVEGGNARCPEDGATMIDKRYMVLLTTDK